MRIRWTEKASNDALEIYDFIAKNSETYAATVYNQILDRPEPQLIDHPHSGSVVPEFEREDIREVFVHSFRIIHLVLKDEIRILTVCHGANPVDVDPENAG